VAVANTLISKYTKNVVLERMFDVFFNFTN